jgi:D-3-phosphoglycerate dehydrogenase / 2-oxoglutarate reductase
VSAAVPERGVPTREEPPHLILDFDSTLISVEGLDQLFLATLDDGEDRTRRARAFQAITDRGMAGELSFQESLAARMALLRATPGQVGRVAGMLEKRITPSALRCRARLRRQAHRIWVVSGGFEELIRPVLRRVGLREKHLSAHRFQWSEEGVTTGIDPDTALARGGKALAVRELRLGGEIWMIGDGATDLELRERGLVHRFFAFTENVSRPRIVAKADAVLESFEDLPTLD